MKRPFNSDESRASARRAFMVVKRSFEAEIDALVSAQQQLAGSGLLDGLDIDVVTGPSEYLFGEETGALEVIEGEDPLPRLVPPYLYGLFTRSPQLGWSVGETESLPGEPAAGSNPTLVNNVETLAHVPRILAHGADWFRASGTERSPGHTIVTVVGDVRHAGVGEVALGTLVRDVIETVGGGVANGRVVKAVLSGVANPVLVAARLDTPLSYEDLDAAGAGLGAAGFAVFDDKTDMLEVAVGVSRFLYVESCGQCPACKFGCGEITAYLERVLANQGSTSDLDVIAARLDSVTDANRCYLGAQERQVIASILREFPEDVEAHLSGAVPAGSASSVCPIVDIRDGEVVYDERQRSKRPDWTYADTAPHEWRMSREQ